MGKLYPDHIRLINQTRLRNWEKIVETHKHHLQLKIERKFSSTKFNDWNNTNDVELVMRHDFYPEVMIKEDANFVPKFIPRFSVKKQDNPLFAQFPPNKEVKYNRDLMIKAIEFGMILMIQYRGDKDEFVQGHQRVIYPMVLGTSAKGKPLLRAFHLRGWSISKNGNSQKDWRMFRTDRILSMSFTGSFFRLPPAGYNQKDKGMRGGIIIAADFDKIRANQKTLIQKNLIQNKKEVVLDDKKAKITAVQIDQTDTILDLMDPFANPNISPEDKSITRLTFLKGLQNNHYVAILGALGQKGNNVKLMNKGKYMGTYKVIKSTMGDALGKPHLKKLEGHSEFDLVVFVKKLN